MTARGEPGFLEALHALTDALGELPAPAMVIGGVAVIARGVPRSTVDIDAAVLADVLDLEHLVETCTAHDIGPRIPDAINFARSHQVYLAVHNPSAVPIDISLAWLPFEREALERSTTVEFESVRIRVPVPEDLLIYKLVAARSRDLDDAEQLLLLYGRTMDLGRARRVIRELARSSSGQSRVTHCPSA